MVSEEKTFSFNFATYLGIQHIYLQKIFNISGVCLVIFRPIVY